MTQRDVRDYIQDIADSTENVPGFVKGLSFTRFRSDLKTIYAVVKGLEVIGEATKRIPADFRRRYPRVPWSEMAKMRDKLVHDYFGIDLDVVWKTIREDIPRLRPLIKSVLKDLD
jgi:uncharacterized protein with HEPN domain